MLRLRNETPGVQPALAAVPLAILGGVALAAWWWRRRGTGGQRPAGDWLRRVVTNLEVDDGRHEVLRFVRDTLAGLGKAEVRRLLGAPSAAGEEGVIVAEPGRARQAVADHWYYRLDRLSAAGQEPGAALVVEFDEANRASNAKFLIPR